MALFGVVFRWMIRSSGCLCGDGAQLFLGELCAAEEVLPLALGEGGPVAVEIEAFHLF